MFSVLASSKEPIMVLPHGQTGLRMRPSRQELSDTFNSEDEFVAAEFILRNGRLITPSNMKERGDLRRSSTTGM